MVTMQATVLRVEQDHLLVFERGMDRRVIVHTGEACDFRRGDRVCIRYSGAMTLSIPPQISAITIRKLPRFGFWHRSCR